ncbi:MAG: zinc-binding dehydrogenase [Roseitalea sp.]|nr:zinc-binding dehydrogenase [Roseitalea sp.]MBO6721356.1 zinc-binding dehydrogenase [Roseitalea sp.]MBO6744541.1 zinc-binding dehydrogenase [Roseitalea sp.]
MAVVDGPDGPTLELIDAPVPQPSDTQMLVRVAAAGLNRADLRRTQAHFKVKGPVIAGLEVAGTVVSAGKAVTGFAVGDRIAAMAAGGYADYAVAEDVSAFKVPGSVSGAQAAALATWYMTAHDALVTEGGFKPGASVLVTAAASGIGIATAQVARALGAGKLIAAVRRPKNDPDFLALGWDAVIDGDGGALRSGVAEATNDRGVDIIIDMVGAGVLDALLDAAALGGTIVSVGRMGGFHETIDLDKLALKRIKLTGVTFRTRDRALKGKVRDAMINDLWPHLESGAISPPVAKVLPLERALDAQELMAANRHFGKIVLSTTDGPS